MTRAFSYGSRTMLVAFFGAVLATTALAQSTTDGAIGGTVFDAQGAVVPHAKITVANEGTGTIKTVTGDDRGYYRVPQLQPGEYTVTVESAGFSGFKGEHVIVEVGRVTSIEPHMKVGGSTESVTVTDQAPTINV